MVQDSDDKAADATQALNDSDKAEVKALSNDQAVEVLDNFEKIFTERRDLLKQNANNKDLENALDGTLNRIRIQKDKRQGSLLSLYEEENFTNELAGIKKSNDALITLDAQEIELAKPENKDKKESLMKEHSERSEKMVELINSHNEANNKLDGDPGNDNQKQIVQNSQLMMDGISEKKPWEEVWKQTKDIFAKPENRKTMRQIAFGFIALGLMTGGTGPALVAGVVGLAATAMVARYGAEKAGTFLSNKASEGGSYLFNKAKDFLCPSSKKTEDKPPLSPIKETSNETTANLAAEGAGDTHKSLPDASSDNSDQKPSDDSSLAPK